MSFFTELDMYLLGQSTHYDIYKKFGAHPQTVKKKKGVMFDVLAPNASAVYVIGEFNNWDETSHKMDRIEPTEMGVYELFIPGAKIGQLYKYVIVTPDGEKLYKADPYANAAELRPGTASKIADISSFKWTDSDGWQIEQKRTYMRSLLLFWRFIPDHG